MQPPVAYDYRSAIALITAHPRSHFAVTAEGGICKESAAAYRFGHRGVTQLERDADVGKALIEMYGRQVLLESATAHPRDALSPSGLTNPRHDAAVANYIAAYKLRCQQDASYEANSPDAKPLSMLDRPASVPAKSSAKEVDPGSRNLEAVQSGLAQRGLSADGLVAQTEKLVQLVRGYTPAQLSAINEHFMGFGSVSFLALYEDPSLLEVQGLSDQQVLAERSARFQRLAEQATDGLKQYMLNTRDQWIINRWRQGGSTGPELMEHWLNIQQVNAPHLEAITRGFPELVARVSPEEMQTLQRYNLEARSMGLSAEQAMQAIRLFSGIEDRQTLTQVWEAEPEMAPQIDQLRLFARMVDEGIPLTDDQRQEVMRYLPPSST